MDKIWLYGVKCRVRIGVTPAERKNRQRVLIDVGMELDTARAAQSDDFRKTVDYAMIEGLVRGQAEAGERRLVETLARHTAETVLRADRRVQSVEVMVHKKPAAMPKTREVVVAIRRTR